jgi:tetratricopeptide (TPR) repeat protein
MSDRLPEALEAARKAAALDLLNEALHARLLEARRYDEAIAETRRVLSAGGPRGVHLGLGRIDLCMGRYEDAITEFEQMPMLANSAPDAAVSMRRTLAQGGGRALLHWWAGFLERQNWRPFIPANIAWFYSMAGDNDPAFALLGRTVADGRLPFAWSLADPGWDPIRTDPRFRELLRKANLPASLATPRK